MPGVPLWWRTASMKSEIDLRGLPSGERLLGWDLPPGTKIHKNPWGDDWCDGLCRPFSHPRKWPKRRVGRGGEAHFVRSLRFLGIFSQTRPRWRRRFWHIWVMTAKESTDLSRQSGQGPLRVLRAHHVQQGLLQTRMGAWLQPWEAMATANLLQHWAQVATHQEVNWKNLGVAVGLHPVPDQSRLLILMTTHLHFTISSRRATGAGFNDAMEVTPLNVGGVWCSWSIYFFIENYWPVAV